MNCTVDASVFVAAARPSEAQHRASVAFLRFVQAQGATMVSPAIVLPESAAAIARPTGDEELARGVIAEMRQLPNVRLVFVDRALALEASAIAIAQRLRGADSIYVAVAQTFAATLVTWDSEMLERAAPAAVARTPSDWLEQQEAGAAAD